MQNNNPKLKMVEKVVIINIVTPDKFFVRKKHLQDVFKKLREDLEQEYRQRDDSECMYLPAMGMLCVVKVDRRYRAAVGADWARARVSETPGRRRAYVQLVDCGALLLVHCRKLRRMSHKFSTLPPLAIECHLAGVAPIYNKWDGRSVALMQQFADVALEMKIEDNRPGCSLGVSLYDRRKGHVVCINQEMIRHNYAASFGLYFFNQNTAIEDKAYTNRAHVKKQQPKPQKKSHAFDILQKETSSKKKISEKSLEVKYKRPISLEAKILHYQSPSFICVSLIQQQQVYNELFQKIHKYYNTKKTQNKVGWKVGDRCCTICKASRTWRRGLIIEIKNAYAKIFYTDFACVEKVAITKLCELAPEFTFVGDATIRCHLSGVVPAVGNKWPSLTIDFLKKQLVSHKRIFITKVGHYKDNSMPIQIWVNHVIHGGALEPDKFEWHCLNQKIINRGLGVSDKTQDVSSTGQVTMADSSDMISFRNVTGSVADWLQLKPLPTKGEPLPTILEHDRESDLINTAVITDWQPAEPLPCKKFTAVPTFVDNDGVIYLHDALQQETLELISKALDLRFKDPDPKANYAKWSVGEPCIAMFFLDKKYYRGRVLEVYNEKTTCLIHYIDYGNEEECSFKNLRKSIALNQIPIQAHKCVLGRIKPEGDHWDLLALDYIHKYVVEKSCYVKVTGEPINGIVPIELKCDRFWINDHLVELEMAVYTDGCKAQQNDESADFVIDENNTPAPSYTEGTRRDTEGNDCINNFEEEFYERFITYSKESSEEFLCYITVINNMNQFELKIIRDEDDTLTYEELNKDINKNCENMCPLNGILGNKACIAHFAEDQKWYRAIILQYSEAKNQIKVRYVDYGDVSVVSLADVREIDENWAKLPPATVTARLSGVRLNTDVDVSAVAAEYTKVFLEQGPFRVKVVAYEDSMPIVELRNEDDALCYEELIAKGIFLPV